VTGESSSSDFPGGPPVGSVDILVASFAENGTLISSKLIGGTGEDWGSGIAVDNDGNIYVVGTSSSLNFPITSGAWGGGPTDAVIVKLLPAFTIGFATYLGGNDEEDGYAIAIDTVQGLCLAGTTLSTDFPVTAGAYDTSPNGGMDVFVAGMHLGSDLPNKITYATYLGASGDDADFGVATDTRGLAYVTGYTDSSLFPTTAGAPDSQLSGTNDAFVAKLKVGSPPGAPVMFLPIVLNSTSEAVKSPLTEFQPDCPRLLCQSLQVGP
jgi:hypothetical protein